MHLPEADTPTDIANTAATVAAKDPRCMTQAELRRLGVHSVVYLRCGTIDGETAYAIHAADGTAVAVVEDIDLAVELATEHGMSFVAVH